MGKWNLRWDDEAKIAAVFYCYLSLDKMNIYEKGKHFTALFDIKESMEWYLSTLGLKTPDEKTPGDDGDWQTYLENKLKNPERFAAYSIAYLGFPDVKDEITKYCDEVIDGFSADERYDCIIEEMDRFSADSNSGILSFDSRKYLWVFVMYSISADILSETRRKYLKHLCRIAGLDKSVLPEMEEAARTIIAIGQKRLEAKASNEPYAKVTALLADLDIEETAAQETVDKLLGVEKSEETSDDEDDDDHSCIEDIADGICNGIYAVTEGITSFIEGIAAKI
jgi:hypothetical protein